MVGQRQRRPKAQPRLCPDGDRQGSLAEHAQQGQAEEAKHTQATDHHPTDGCGPMLPAEESDQTEDERNRGRRHDTQSAKDCNRGPSPRLDQHKQEDHRRRDQRQVATAARQVQRLNRRQAVAEVGLEDRRGFHVHRLVQSCASTGWVFTVKGSRSNSTLTVTRLPARSLGTRHECEHTPPHPNSRLPDPTCFPSFVWRVNCGFGGSPAWSRPRANVAYVSPPAPKTSA